LGVDPVLSSLHCTFERLSAPVPIFRAQLARKSWKAAASLVRSLGGRLVSLWATDRRPIDGQMAVHAAYATADGLAWVTLPLADLLRIYPGIDDVFPEAARMQRAIADLVGLLPEEHHDERPWLRHDAWPCDYHPLLAERTGLETFESPREAYPFVAVEGDGVHEIPVGPVHAGIIEPGHFRFSVVGEKVLRLEERLGYTHKGIEKRFEGRGPLDRGCARLAARVSGDSTVAYGWAYAMAVESAGHCEVPPRAQWLRAMALERERVANHLGDLGALGNDAGFAFGLAQFSRLKEDWLRLNAAGFGHRYAMDYVVPGGVSDDPGQLLLESVSRQCNDVRHEVQQLRSIYEEHSGLQDRFAGTGRVTCELAARLGLTGLAGRASGQARDLRSDFRFTPYDLLQATCASNSDGDVAARVAVRFDETLESLRMIQAMARRLQEADLQGSILSQPHLAATEAIGAGWVEGWRGPVLVALELDQYGIFRRCHCHDPSWQNWPLLEHAVIGNIVPDFPLINKSFNLSYSGQDL
jgi:Ni,Fe-hydrogenase III large subunit/Ni,Fe-hydrogenase III component G